MCDTPATVAAAVGDNPDSNAAKNVSRTDSGNGCPPGFRPTNSHSITQHLATNRCCSDHLSPRILTEVAATLSLRASDGFRKKIWLIPVAVGYLASFGLMGYSLSLGMPVGIAYGIWAACGVALVAVFAKFLFAEPLTWLMGLGIGFIIAGVVTIEFIGSAH